MKQLNIPELELLKYLWKIEKGFLKDIINQYPEPRPAYTTISTLVRRMCAKNYIGFESLGRDKLYFPLLEKEKYFSSQVNGMIKNFFNNSTAQFASFFAKETELNEEQLNELKQIIDNRLKSKK